MKELSLVSPSEVVSSTIAQPFVMQWLGLKGESPSHNAAVAAAEREYFNYHREEKTQGNVPLFKAYWIWSNRHGTEWEENLNSFVINQVRNAAFRVFTESGVNYLRDDAPVYNIVLDSDEIYHSVQEEDTQEDSEEYLGLEDIIVNDEDEE